MKTDKGLKSIISIIASEEQSNQALVVALAAAPALLPPPPSANATTASISAQPTRATVTTIAAAFPATSIKFNSILCN